MKTQALNLEETSQRYLSKQLAKTKRIAESPEFIRLEKALMATFTTGSGPRDPAEANVTARLYKSNPVQSALPNILSDIRNILGVDENQPKKPQEKKQADKATDDEDKSTVKAKTSDKKRDAPLDSAIENDHSADVEEPDDASMHDVSDDDESLDLSQFDARLASDSEEEEEGSSDNELAGRPTITKPKYDVADDLSISSGSVSGDQSETPPPSQLKGSKRKAVLEADKPPKDTTFLPSLMMGGYWSGSESEPEDDEITNAATGRPQRKNRMGQQARRALWEKKFGNSAKHLQDQKDDNGRRDGNKNSGWDARRGATDYNDKPRWAKRGVQQPSSSFERRRDESHSAGPAAHQASKSSAASSAPLHPSWEAARKAKQAKAQASFQGKKITFD